MDDPRDSNSGEQTLPESSMSLGTAVKVDDLCDRFEAAWTIGRQPTIEHFLADAADPQERAARFEALLALDLELRKRRGQTLDREDYLDDFPEYEPVIERFFRAIDDSAIIDDRTIEQARETVDDDSDRTIDVLPLSSSATGSSLDADISAEVVHEPWRPELQRLGRYELMEEIGRGGMGVVYKARQMGLNRWVALKTIRAGGMATYTELERFRLEAESAAKLDHPNIVTIHDVGEQFGQSYFTMRLVEGGNLSGKLKALREDPEAAARLLSIVARAVDHAHRHGILHRDLKPGNILIDEDGGPHITDFGLAKRLETDDAGVTQSGAIVGTPSYMAPEQAAGGAGKPVTASADIYSLGAILYEMLTGRPPFRAGSVMETVMQVLEREPIPPRRVRAEAPRDLELICLKCLDKDPSHRYPTAIALAEDLERYLRGEDVEARRTGFVQRVTRWARREPKLAFGLAGLGLIEILLLFNAWLRPSDFSALMRVSAIMVVWALFKIGYQWLARRPEWTDRVPTFWIVTEVILFTIAVRLVDGVTTSLVVGFPLLIVLSGLWSRAGLVWLSLIAAELGFGLLAIDAGARGISWEHGNHPDIFMAAMFVIAIAVAHQVKRLWALSRYFENRPGRG